MRKLNQKEIDDAPGWAVSYNIEINSVGTDYPVYHERHYGFTMPLPRATPPRKEFDISEYEFSDECVLFDACCDGDVDLEINHYQEGNPYINLDRADTIALAKHFKLTAEDLK